jgi:hypothetical protein
MSCNPGCGEKLDFVFVMDTSVSMDTFVKETAQGLGSMAQNIRDMGVLSRFAVVGFQGYPELLGRFPVALPFRKSTLTSSS